MYIRSGARPRTDRRLPRPPGCGSRADTLAGIGIRPRQERFPVVRTITPEGSSPPLCFQS